MVCGAGMERTVPKMLVSRTRGVTLFPTIFQTVPSLIMTWGSCRLLARSAGVIRLKVAVYGGGISRFLKLRTPGRLQLLSVHAHNPNRRTCAGPSPPPSSRFSPAPRLFQPQPRPQQRDEPATVQRDHEVPKGSSSFRILKLTRPRTPYL